MEKRNIEGLANREGAGELEARTKQLLLRLTPSENARVQAEAQRLGVSKSDVLRLMIRTGQALTIQAGPELLTR